VVLEEDAYKMTQAANMTPLAEHARVLVDVVAKLKQKLELEALARML
jgi:phage terminase large subunit-like protein